MLFRKNMLSVTSSEWVENAREQVSSQAAPQISHSISMWPFESLASLNHSFDVTQSRWPEISKDPLAIFKCSGHFPLGWWLVGGVECSRARETAKGQISQTASLPVRGGKGRSKTHWISEIHQISSQQATEAAHYADDRHNGNYAGQTCHAIIDQDINTRMRCISRAHVLRKTTSTSGIMIDVTTTGSTASLLSLVLQLPLRWRQWW